jgi:hypothetical protein
MENVRCSKRERERERETNKGLSVGAGQSTKTFGGYFRSRSFGGLLTLPLLLPPPDRIQSNRRAVKAISASLLLRDVMASGARSSETTKMVQSCGMNKLRNIQVDSTQQFTPTHRNSNIEKVVQHTSIQSTAQCTVANVLPLRRKSNELQNGGSSQIAFHCTV